MLLGIHRILRATKILTPRKYLEICGNVMEQLGQSNLNNEAYFQAMEPLIKPQIDNMLSHINAFDNAAYEAKLNRIAEFNPILAHQLKTNAMLIEIIPQTRDYWLRYLEMLRTNNVPEEHTVRALPEIEDEIFNRIQSSLKRDILDIGLSVGVLEYFKLKLFLWRTERKKAEDILAPFFKKLLANIEAQQNEQAKT